MLGTFTKWICVDIGSFTHGCNVWSEYDMLFIVMNIAVNVWRVSPETRHGSVAMLGCTNIVVQAVIYHVFLMDESVARL